MKMHAEYVAHFGDDLTVVNAARVSMSKRHEVFDRDSDARLIRYLAEHAHWAPFSHPKVQLRLTLPVFVARQWEKHRIGVVRGYDIYDQSEVSRRYVADEPSLFYPTSWRARPEANIKQGSGGDLPAVAQAACHNHLQAAYGEAMSAYQNLLRLGVAPEQARMVLPQGMFTQWLETGSLAYWARLCRLRLDKHAQKEIRDLAEEVATILADLFPYSWLSLMEFATT